MTPTTNVAIRWHLCGPRPFPSVASAPARRHARPIPSAAARHSVEGNHPGMADIGLVVMLLSDKDLTVHGPVEAIKVQATK